MNSGFVSDYNILKIVFLKQKRLLSLKPPSLLFFIPHKMATKMTTKMVTFADLWSALLFCQWN